MRLNKQAYYDSIDQNETETTPMTSEETPLIRSQPTMRRSHRWGLGLATLVALALLIPAVLNLAQYLPTELDIEIADAFDMPRTMSVLGHIKQARREAQTGGEWHARDHPEVVQKISQKHGTSHYMDVPDGCEATVMLVRHCEKGSVREHCDYMGFERSAYLSTLFGNHGERWPAPSYLFALSPDGRHNRRKMNFREIETLGPLANKTGVTIDDS